MPYAAICYRVKPGNEDRIAEIFAGFQRMSTPQAPAGNGDEGARLLGTAVFVQDDVVVRFVHYEGDFSAVGRHVGAQRGVHLVEEALAPYLAEPRDTKSEKGFARYFAAATMRCVSQLSAADHPNAGTPR
ncbi:SchA/CurD-like domain-containing protein [Amycolatopsis halotolerans]|uniref:SchA/CurD-like domain-containing protein n=1 Tax=Amycolatopsis halotolerans TaxID=330083 RepID=A0ABV7QAV3_9PSEU